MIDLSPVRRRCLVLVVLGFAVPLVLNHLFWTTSLHDRVPASSEDIYAALWDGRWHRVPPAASVTFAFAAVGAAFLVASVIVALGRGPSAWRRTTAPARIFAAILCIHSFMILQALVLVGFDTADVLTHPHFTWSNVTSSLGWMSPLILGLAACPILLIGAARAADADRFDAARALSHVLIAAGLLAAVSGVVMLQDKSFGGVLLERKGVWALTHHNPPITDSFRTTVLWVLVAAWIAVAIVGATIPSSPRETSIEVSTSIDD
jgi:hypothetical protein